MRVLIATAMGPRGEGSFRTACETLRKHAGEMGLRIPEGILWTTGPGCTNLSFELEGGTEEEQESFANRITLGLMPARWTTTKDRLPEKDTLGADMPGEVG